MTYMLPDTHATHRRVDQAHVVFLYFLFCYCTVITCDNYFSAAHYIDVIMTTMASQITSLTVVYWTVHSGADQRKHQSSASLAFVRGIHRGPVNSPHKWPVTRKLIPFDDVIMNSESCICGNTLTHWGRDIMATFCRRHIQLRFYRCEYTNFD